MDQQVTYKITVTGAVQGIGYRPFVAHLAEKMHHHGDVRNIGGNEKIRVTGEESVHQRFAKDLKEQAPTGAIILQVEIEETEQLDFRHFKIVASEEETQTELPVFPPDLATCDPCITEMKDQKDRRYRYPLISCTSCGPRWSILERFPYDRENTRMVPFSMCHECKREYKHGRRRHAQTISCPACGPQMRLRRAVEGGWSDEVYGELAIKTARTLLQGGGIVALKGVGGYQLLCDPTNEKAVARLRAMKGREEKPFAVLFHDLAEIQKYYKLRTKEKEHLESPARPIVLLEHRKRKRNGEPVALPFAKNVCGDSRFLGAFLPCVGIQEMLTSICGPLIATSANVSGAPIPISDTTLQTNIYESPDRPDAIYNHDREILRPLDDSVLKVTEDGKTQMIRRARGFVPMPVLLGEQADDPKMSTKGETILATGGDLKAAFALRKNGRVVLSQYYGDLENYGVLQNFHRGVEDMVRVMEAEPSAVVSDLHPDYFSDRFAANYAKKKGIPLLKVQHHHAHIASVMAEHDLTKASGIAFDGTGYGTDGQLWGGEFLVCNRGEMRRAGALRPVTLCGGNSVSVSADLAASCYLYAVQKEVKNTRERIGFSTEYGTSVQNYPKPDEMVQKAIDAHFRTIESSSMGRLFDAVAALAGICHRNDYEGECAIRLENAAVHKLNELMETYVPIYIEGLSDKAQQSIHSHRNEAVLFDIVWTKYLGYFGTLVEQEEPKEESDTPPMYYIGQAGLVQDLLDLLQHGTNTMDFDEGDAALAFHLAIAAATVDVIHGISEEEGITDICLGGGTFANGLLLKVLSLWLTREGFRVYINEQVPGNDGGLSLGQAYLAGF